MDVRTWKLRMENFFQLHLNQTSWKKEIIGGIIIFASTLYICAANPAILSGEGGAGVEIDPYFLITILSSIVATFVMILFVKMPIPAAPAMGVNAFFAYTIANHMHLTYRGALVVTFLSGWILLFIAITRLKDIILKAIPYSLQIAMVIGIGFFLLFGAFKDLRIMTSDSSNIFKMGNLAKPYLLLGLGVGVLGIILFIKKVPGAIGIAMTLGMLIGLLFSLGPDALSQGMPHFRGWNYGDMFHLKPYLGQSFLAMADLKITWANPNFYVAIFMLILMNFLLSAGIGVAFYEIIEVSDPAIVHKGVGRLLTGSAVGQIILAPLGSSSTLPFGSALTGLAYGARTQIGNIVVIIGFLIAIPLLPIFKLYMPNSLANGGTVSPITSGANIFTAYLLIRNMKSIKWKEFDIIISTFFIIVFSLLGSSFSFAIGIGFIFYLLAALILKKWRDIHWMMYVIVLLNIISIILQLVFI